MSVDHSPKVLHVQFTDKQSLYNSFMSFCQGGGLFIPNGNLHGVTQHLGVPLQMLVELPGDTVLYTVSGKISWINMNKRKGIGVRMAQDEFSRSLRIAIENNLGGMIKGLTPTYTM